MKNVANYVSVRAAGLVVAVGVLTKEGETGVAVLTNSGEVSFEGQEDLTIAEATREEFEGWTKPAKTAEPSAKELATVIYDNMPGGRRCDVVRAMVAGVPGLGKPYADTIYQQLFKATKAAAAQKAVEVAQVVESTEVAEVEELETA